MDSNVLYTFLLGALSLLVLAILVAVLVAYKYLTLKGQVAELARQKFEDWRAEELAGIRQANLEMARREMRVELENWKEASESGIRKDAIQKSQAVTLGKVTEHFIPYLPDFGYNPKDARFLGSPVDFVVFDGLCEGELRKIVFVEIKTGASALSTRERRIRNAILSGKVEWLELRPQWGAAESSGETDAENTQEIRLG